MNRDRPKSLSGKTARDENFPVASLLVSARYRPHVRTFYRFARAMDDVADSPDLDAPEKLRRLRTFERALTDPHTDDAPQAVAMRRSLARTAITPEHCRNLIRAFEQDVTKRRYASLEELMAYCMQSAAPVGRYLIDLHGGPTRAHPASDALCNALQILNHLQDCGLDHRTLDRVYLPRDWMQAEGAAYASLAKASATPALRTVLDRCLSATDGLLAQAAPLPLQLRSVRLAMEASVILTLARRLSKELRRRDPLAERIVLRPWQSAYCMARGIASALWGRLRRRARTTPDHSAAPSA